MKNYTVRRFESRDTALWNAFIGQAKNATFLFHRDFMDYHADRFQDFSLLVFEEEQLIAVLPAHIENGTVFSHWGLTYGGFVLNEDVRLGEALEVVRQTLRFLHVNEIETLRLKLIPGFYNSCFAEEIEYALFLVNAELIRRDCLSVIELTKKHSISRIRKRGIARAKSNDLKVREANDFEVFWNDLLIPNLKNKYNAAPVHSLEEICYLKEKFPDNIKQFNVLHQDEIVGGVTVFINKNVAHLQYVSGTDKDNELGSLDFLYHYLITEVYQDKDYFDFGPSHENKGKNINKGILYWKESFGAKTTVQDFYNIKTAKHTLLENVLI
ncbi:GNAT family N-acetyltransferase [Flavobacterium sp. XGLA_31]|uniref:GNAT family N-acetyltransferase n=1 Tax=Flavobacterium sp. XGLA_31 TaxID=3447666 RepID=UPI003F2C6BEC